MNVDYFEDLTGDISEVCEEQLEGIGVHKARGQQIGRAGGYDQGGKEGQQDELEGGEIPLFGRSRRFGDWRLVTSTTMAH